MLIVTPEALTSPRVADEWKNFIAMSPDWEGHLQVAMLVDTPPPFLTAIQYVDLRDFSARWPQSPIVVTSRPIGYRRPAHDFLELDLLDRLRQREFLARWLGRRTGEPDPREADRALRLLDAESGLRELASNPPGRLALLASHLPRGPGG